MTVQELLIKEGFDNIMKALQKTHYTDSSIGSVAGYKEAYDIITHTQFEGEGGKVTFNVTPKEEWHSPGSLPMLAYEVEGDLWENTVGKEVIYPEDNPFTDAELAGAILWGMTFYGFTQRCTKDLFADEIHHAAYTKYGRMAKRLMIKRELPYATLPGMREDLKKQMKEEGDRMTYYLSMEEWDCLDKRRKHLNRSKKKREYRMKKRIEWLKKLDKRQRLINMISSSVGYLSEGLENDIIHAGAILEEWRESHTYNIGDRIDYILNLLSLPPEISERLSVDAKHIVCCYTSVDSSLSEDEKDRLVTFLKSYKEDITVLYGIDTDVPSGELALQFIGISKTKIDDDE